MNEAYQIMLGYIEQILSTIIIIGLFIGWLGLIVRRRRMLGPAAPLHDRRWFLDVYRRGWGILLRCRWLLWLPLGGLVVAFAEGRIVTALILKKNPELQALHEQHAHRIEEMKFLDFLKTLPSSLPRNFLSSADSLTDAIFSPLFRSYFFIALFLFSIMVILLRSRDVNDETLGEIHFRRRKMLGATSGVAAVILFFMYVCFVILKQDFPLWYYFPFTMLYMVVPAFGFATVLSAIEAADQGESGSFPTAVSKGGQHFQALFPFFVLTAGIGFLFDLLPPYIFSLLRSDVFMFETFQQAVISIKIVFFIMISFIPLLVVIQKASLKEAFDSCIELWAKEWKNLSAFIAIGALLLLIPVAMERRVQVLSSGIVLIGSGGIFGWLVQLLKVVLGALTLASFVVFLKTLQEKSLNAT